MQARVYHLRIDYTEPDQSSYRSVSIHVNGKNGPRCVRKFKTGDPENDWKDANEWVRSRKDLMCCMMSSSCDHFVMDGEAFEWMDYGSGGEMIVHSK